MIRCETIGQIEVAKVNPVIKMEQDVVNNSFIEHEGDKYLVSNTITGDGAYKDDVVIKAGEFVNGYRLDAWHGQKLVVDGKHIEGGVATLNIGDKLVIGSDGKLTAYNSESGIYFVVTDFVTLTEAAVKVQIVAM